MSGYRQPLPPSVYRRRRLAVLGGLLAIVTVVVLLIVRPGFGETAAPEVTDETGELAPPPVLDCTASQITLIAETDALRYNPGEIPQLWLTVENVGGVECQVDAGALNQQYVITSGEDQIWSSKDCQKDPAVPNMITLQPGESRSTQAIPWDRTRSSETTCDEARPMQPGGGASYHLRVFLGDFQSEETRQFILN
jgi:hypothetical protein